MKIIDEVRELTANEVAKKQDAAKNNYPRLIESIKKAAGEGESQCTFLRTELNEYDKRLLEADGFTVWLRDKPKDLVYDLKTAYNSLTDEKYWIVKW